MDEEWHVSDSEDEESVVTPNIISSTLEKLSTLSQKDSNTCFDQHYTPGNLIDLYERIENEGVIALHCQGSQDSVCFESKEGETQIISVASPLAVDNEDPPNPLATNKNSNHGTLENKPVTSNEFDYKEELFETTVMFPKRTPKSGKKTKRVGTMENVINDLNRFKKINAQTMGNQQQQ